jgi:hypothetical protein
LENPSVERLFWFNFRDFKDDLTARSQYGLIRNELSPKPSFLALRNLTRLLGKAGWRPRRVLEAPIWAFEFRSEAKKIWVLWSMEKTEEQDILVSSETVTLVDLMGNEQQQQAVDGKVSLSLGPEPVYLILE